MRDERREEKDFQSNLCKKYSPNIAIKLLANYIKSKACKVKIPNLVQENSKQNCSIASDIEVTECDIHDNSKKTLFRINPQNL